MKTTSIIALFLFSLALMATNNIIQGFIALSCLALSVCLMNKNKKEVFKTVVRFETKVLKLLKID